MRKGWTETTLDGLIDLYTGKLDVNASKINGQYPFFTCAREIFRINDFAFDGKAVLVAGNGDLNVKYYEGKFNAYQRTYVLFTKDEALISPSFLFLYMSGYIDQLRSDTQGSTIQYLKKNQFTDAPINLPPLQEQKRIVDLISSVDSYIDALQQQAGNARKSRNAVLHEMLNAGGDGWTETTLPHVVEVLDRLRRPISAIERDRRIGAVPYFGANGQAGWIDEFIFNETLVLLGEDAIDFLNPKASKAYMVTGPSWVNNHAHVLRADTSKVLPYFLTELLNAVDYSQYVSFGTRSKLTQGSMNGIKLQIPPLLEQKRIVDLISSMDDAITTTEVTIAETKKLRSGLLSDLLSGNHEIPDSYDKIIGAA
jgi:restriction endonuclease S subunit